MGGLIRVSRGSGGWLGGRLGLRGAQLGERVGLVGQWLGGRRDSAAGLQDAALGQHLGGGALEGGIGVGGVGVALVVDVVAGELLFSGALHCGRLWRGGWRWEGVNAVARFGGGAAWRMSVCGACACDFLPLRVADFACHLPFVLPVAIRMLVTIHSMAHNLDIIYTFLYTGGAV